MLKKFEGCLIGLAVGDALGAPVEFLKLFHIKTRYGEEGITDFQPWHGFDAGCYTDDTQLTLATANGIIQAYTRQRAQGSFEPAKVVFQFYQDWLKTQSDTSQRRAPGKTCLATLEQGYMGTISIPINNSKGSGGIMRVAPAGLAYQPSQAFRMGAEFAAITHGHPSAYLSAGFFAEMISHLVNGTDFEESIARSLEELIKYPKSEEMFNVIQRTRKMISLETSIEDALKIVGEGNTGDSALSIALICCLRHKDEFKKAIYEAINHSGDSDTTGALTGALIGAHKGIDYIPSSWIAKVENSILLRNTAETLQKMFKPAMA